MTQVHTIARDSAPTSATSTRKPRLRSGGTARQPVSKPGAALAPSGRRQPTLSVVCSRSKD
jgi:hypothetical protein